MQDGGDIQVRDSDEDDEEEVQRIEMDESPSKDNPGAEDDL